LRKIQNQKFIAGLNLAHYKNLAGVLNIYLFVFVILIGYFAKFSIPEWSLRLFEISRFWVCLKPTFEAKNVDKTVAHLLPKFKGRVCKLDFPALPSSNFAA